MADHVYPLTKSMAKAYTWAIAKRVWTGDRFNSQEFSMELDPLLPLPL